MAQPPTVTPTSTDYNSYQLAVQLDSTALTREKTKEVYGFAAFLQLGLDATQGAVKYRIEKKRLVPMKDSDYTIPFINVSTMPLSRKYHQASSEDLNFFSVEIPKFIRWYLWNEETQEKASEFVKKVCLEGLKHLKEVCYKSDSEVQKRITLWMDMMSMAIQEPIDNVGLTHKINLYLRTNSAFNEKINEFTKCLNEIDLPFGTRIKELVTLQDFERINKLFDKSGIIKQHSIQQEINNANTRYTNERHAALRQTVSREILEMHQRKPIETPNLKKGSGDFPRPGSQGSSPTNTSFVDGTSPVINSTNEAEQKQNENNGVTNEST